jgi:2-polyprenyl-3-methyl-5-hydroxy-6-metoxy-1,4-benzoquinol methylase
VVESRNSDAIPRKVNLARPSSDPSPRPCPLCGGLKHKPVFRQEVWEIVVCGRCGMVFIASHLAYDVQARDHDWVEEHAKEFRRRKKRQPVMLFFSRVLRPLRPDTNSRMLSQTLRFRREGKLVDFACGEGGFLKRAAPYFDLTGIELSPRSAEISRQRVPSARILEGPVTEVSDRELGAGSFDLVTQFGYIEHEWHPLEGLRAAYRLLKPGGVTVIKTPNYDSWNRYIRGLDWCGYHIPGHCNYFTPRTLSQLLHTAGFEPLRRPILDRLPTSDSLWMAARKPA